MHSNFENGCDTSAIQYDSIPNNSPERAAIMKQEDPVQAYRASTLLFNNLKQRIEAPEKEELLLWLEKNELNRQLFNRINDQERLWEILQEWSGRDLTEAFERVYRRISIRKAGLLKIQGIPSSFSIVLSKTAAMFRIFLNFMKNKNEKPDW